MLDQKTIGAKISDFRKKRGLSVSAFAKLVGIARQQEYLRENGKTDIPLSSFLKSCDVLGISPAEFFDHHEDKREPTNTDLMNQLMVLQKKIELQRISPDRDVERDKTGSPRALFDNANRGVHSDRFPVGNPESKAL